MAAAMAVADPVAETIETPPRAEDASAPVFSRMLSVLDSDFEVGPWKLHGYLQYDIGAYDQDAAGPLETDARRGPSGAAGPDARALESGALLRRARLGGQGALGQHVAYRAMFELSEESEPRIAEVWVSYNRWAPYTLQIGAFPQPMSMEDATSSNSRIFLERATVARLARSLGAGDGRLGVTLRRSTARGMAGLSLTGPVIDHAEEYSPQGAILARVLQRVAKTSAYSLYLGLTGTWVFEPSDKVAGADRPPEPMRLKAPPELLIDNTPLIDTGYISARRARVLGVEFAAQKRNFMIQSEAFSFDLEREGPAGLADPHFWGFYVHGAWQVTGEARRFDPVRGAFFMPNPSHALGEGGFGSLEVGVRYSRMNLNDRIGVEGALQPPDGVRGGDQQIFGLSLEWFPRSRFRLMLNALHIRVDRLNPASAANPEPFGPSPATPPPGVQIGQSLNAVAIRARYGF